VSVPDDRRAASAARSRSTVGVLPDHAADHAAIGRLIDDLVPALVAKLASLNVGELEVRQDGWRVRLQRPAGAGPLYGRRVADRAGQRAHPGHDGVGSQPAPRAAQHAAAAHAGGSNGAGGPRLTPPAAGRDAGDGAPQTARPDDRATDRALIATSPAVGVFQPGAKAVGGTRVRAGDRLGVVDMLGIPQDVVAPADGIVIGVIVDGGTAVEYGQELVHLDAAGAVEAR
jgi:biotin carboxyl carrier protein